VQQNGDGSRVPIKTNIGCEEVWPRSHDLVLSTYISTSIEGVVENINPETESVFALLGRHRGPGLTLFFNLEHDVIPGIELGIKGYVYDFGRRVFDLVLPNLIEKWRVDYTSGGQAHPMEVIWRASAYKPEFVEERDDIEKCGWDITETGERLIPPPENEAALKRYLDGRTAEDYIIEFDLRRKPIKGLVVAQGPCELSWTGYF